MLLSNSSIQVNPRCYKCGVTSYYLNPENDTLEGLLNQSIDYKEVEKRLSVEKERSREWLKNALEMPLPVTPSLTDTMISKISLLENKFAQLEEKVKKLLS